MRDVDATVAGRAGAGRVGGATAVEEATEISVLAVEDSNTQAELIRAFLRDSRLAGHHGVRFDVVRVSSLAGAAAQLTRDERFDVVLLDLTLPDSAGLDTLDAVRALTDLPVVVLSASDASAGYSVIEHGAQDFVVKDASSLPGLPRAIRYAVRRARLTHELEEALEAREAADTRLRTLLSMASHELRSPLASLRGLSSLLVDRWDQLEQTQRLEFAERINRRLGHAIAVATLYLNAAADDDDIHAVPADVSLQQLCNDVATTIPQEPDEIDVAKGMVTFDPNHLAAILVNLLSNAAKYGRSPVRLEGDATRLVVSDGGDGVAEENVASLFQPWHRQARDGIDSTGLGLALAGQLARANGSALGYERKDGRTLFTLDMPQG